MGAIIFLFFYSFFFGFNEQKYEGVDDGRRYGGGQGAKKKWKKQNKSDLFFFSYTVAIDDVVAADRFLFVFGRSFFLPSFFFFKRRVNVSTSARCFDRRNTKKKGESGSGRSIKGVGVCVSLSLSLSLSLSFSSAALVVVDGGHWFSNQGVDGACRRRCFPTR